MNETDNQPRWSHTVKHRRGAFRMWLSSRNRGTTDSNALFMEKTSIHQGRHEEATMRYTCALAERKSKALKFISRRQNVLMKLERIRSAKSSEVAQKHMLAAQKFEALNKARIERLQARHHLIEERLARLVRNQRVDDQALEEKFHRALKLRAEFTGRRSARAGARVIQAKRKSAMSQAIHLRAVEDARLCLEQRLHAAEGRRVAALSSRIKNPKPPHQASLATNELPSITEQLPSTADQLPSTIEQGVFTQCKAELSPTCERDLQRDFELSSPEDNFRRKVCREKLERCWQNFARTRPTTRSLAMAFAASGVTAVRLLKARGNHLEAAADARQSSGEAGPEALVLGPAPARVAMQNPKTVNSAQALLQRLQQRLTTRSAPLQSCNQQLRRLFPKNPAYQENAAATAAGAPSASSAASARSALIRRVPAGRLPGSRAVPGKSAAAAAKPERYPARIFLSAWMITHYPRVIFNNEKGEREIQLAQLASELVAVFEALMTRMVAPKAGGIAAHSAVHLGTQNANVVLPPHTGTDTSQDCTGDDGDGEEVYLRRERPRGLLQMFDDAWVRYLDQFAAWKTEDAGNMEFELIRMAVEFERSFQRKQLLPEGDVRSRRAKREIKLIEAQVALGVWGNCRDLQA
ncbi:hypothetical protein CEUSTIGMA_g8794.t1 [Chlamydomonas eustigma]|uniref:Uncharacterized protein n=1 Tax=Chlamydomonas eustigma TaxID=1157962 RepID=A0A250XE61_9CHLO|nr:hypothetical protein CEUSTIGMA_g8794.t1 [Chlamydomonas eustigma]|eukprot:GAX81363.1 hypothetical protein CEUSTIGMA_g8794.t1 [Chlamydomonas eustigma]